MGNEKLYLKIELLETKIAILQDQLEFASDQADTFAKSLKEIEKSLEDFLQKYEYIRYIHFTGLDLLTEIKKIKNSIPENALKR